MKLFKLFFKLPTFCLLSLFFVQSIYANEEKTDDFIKTNPSFKGRLGTYTIEGEKGIKLFCTEFDKSLLDRVKEPIVQGNTLLSVSDILIEGSLSFLSDKIDESGTIVRTQTPEDVKRLTDKVTLIKKELVKYHGGLPVLYGTDIENLELITTLAQSIKEKQNNRLFDSIDHSIFVTTSTEQLSALAEKLQLPFRYAFKVYLHSLVGLAQYSKRQILLNIDGIDALNSIEVDQINQFYLGVGSRGGVKILGSSSNPDFDPLKFQEYSLRLISPIASNVNEPGKTAIDPKILLLRELSKAGITVPENLLKIRDSYTKKYKIEIPDDVLIVLAQSPAIQQTLKLLENTPQAQVGIEHQEISTYLEEAIVLAIERDDAKVLTVDDVRLALKRRSAIKIDLPFDPSDLAAKLAYKKDLIERMNKKVFGQERIVEDLVSLYIRVISNPNKGIGTMAMLGPTGTGKTLSAETLAEEAYGRKDAIFTINGSEFGGYEASSALRKLFGAPPSYVGHDQGRGAFVEWMEDENRGYKGGIIVINEADKAGPAFWQYFMEFLDGKGIQKNGGGTAQQQKQKGASEPILKATNHLVVITTNQGDAFLYPDEMKKLSEADSRQWVDRLTQAELKEVFVSGGNGGSQAQLHPSIPERIEVFSPAYLLSEKSARSIISSKLSKISKDYSENYEITLNWDSSITEYFLNVFYDKTKGARRINSAVDNQILNNLENALEELKVAQNDQVNIRVRKDVSGYFLDVATNQNTVSRKVEGNRIIDAVKDPEALERVQNLEKRMKEKVHGQEYAIHVITQAARGKMAKLDPNDRPLSIFLTGASGVGKTELFRALAYGWYGSEKRLRLIQLEEVQNVEEIFGSINDSYMGKQPMRLFEKALNDNKDGGVILFDEVDKIGGGNPHVIRQFMLQMHSILEEGVWIAPSGKTYPMGKYVIGYTANFLSNLFDGIPRYEVQKMIWEDNSGRDTLTGLLVQSIKMSGGMPVIPDSFIKRQDVVLLAEPLAPENTLRISEKQIANELGFYEKDLGTKIKITDEFVKQITASYFSLNSGAGRAVRNILRSHFKSYINMVRADIRQRYNDGETELDIDQLEIELKINDNLPHKAYITNLSWEREVEIVLISRINGKVVDERKYNISKTVPEKRRVAAKHALSTAYHEAGHAAANVMEKTLSKLNLITIFSDGPYLGVNIFEDVKNTEGTNYDWDRAKHRIAMGIAGEKAQVLAGYTEDTGQSGDQAQIDRLIRVLLVKGKFHPDVKGVQFDEEGNIKYANSEAQRKFNALVEKLYAESDKLAVELLTKNWNLVRDVTALLMKQGDISGKEFEAMKKAHDIALAKGHLQKWIINNDGHLVKLDKDTILGRWSAKRKKQESPLRNLDPKLSKCEDGLKAS